MDFNVIYNTVSASINISFVGSILFVFLAYKQSKKIKIPKRMTNDDFMVMLGDVSTYIIFSVVMWVFTIVMAGGLSNEKSYVMIALLLPISWGFIYYIIKCYTYRLKYKNGKITFYTFLRKPYEFTINDITLAEIKRYNFAYGHIDELKIKTNLNRTFKISSSEVAYEKFVAKIIKETPHDRLIGFEEYFEQQN